MKVLLVGPSLGGGGAEKRFLNIAKSLFDGSADVAVLTGPVPDKDLSPERVTNLLWEGRLSYFSVVCRLRRLIREKRYDVIMSFGLFPNIVSVFSLIGLPNKSKLIVSEITRPVMETLTSKFWRRIAYSALRARLYKRSDLITANSIDGVRETSQLVGIDASCVSRVPNVIDVQVVKEQSAQSQEHVVEQSAYIICVGRLDYMKRIDTVIAAYSITCTDKNVALLIVGDGPEKRNLEEQVSDLGLVNKVRFLGSLNNPFPILKNALMYVLASEYEGFSNSVLEAMILGVPVITSYCSEDARSMCKLGAAMGFDVGDSVALSEKMKKLILDHDVAGRVVTEAHLYSEEHCLPEAIQQYEQLMIGVFNRVPN